MTGMLRRVPARTAMGVILVSVLVLVLCVLWLAQRAGTNDAADRRQASEIAANQGRLDDVTNLARNLKAGLTNANRKLRANGVAPVPVPTSSLPGQAGEDGEDGEDGEEGQPGSTGVAGRDGQPGAVGSPGPAGETGSNGADGVGLTGQVGPQGQKGETGATGATGANGRDGTNGVDGQPGVQGQPGQPGQPGVDGKPPTSFTFTDALGITYTCADPDGDTDYTCETR